MNIDLDIVHAFEKLILNKISWKFNLSTAAEMKSLLLSLDENQVEEEVEENISDLINFSLHEYEIYSQYDQSTIVAASVLISYNHFTKDTKLIEEALVKLNCNILEVQKLKEQIFYFMNKEDDKEQVNENLDCFRDNNSFYYIIDENNRDFIESYNDECRSTNLDSIQDLDESSQKTFFSEESDYLISGEDNEEKKELNFLGRKRLGKCDHVEKYKTKKSQLDETL
jgi:hypothetical protein